MTNNDLRTLAAQLGQVLISADLRMATAESCTGGWVAKAITDLPGSSAWFDAAIVSYSNEAKQRLLGVPEATLEQHGAVSEATVKAMLAGIFEHTAADVGVSISGIAGPEGGSPEKPVGSVWLAWGLRAQAVQAQQYHFKGEREAVRSQAAAEALKCLILLVEADR